jgi:hypothetical protein
MIYNFTHFELIFNSSLYSHLVYGGAGGTFALYSLLCRHANVSLLPNRQLADEELSTYKLEHSSQVTDRSRLKKWLQKHKNLRTALLLMVMVGTCMVIGDGVLTPALSGRRAAACFIVTSLMIDAARALWSLAAHLSLRAVCFCLSQCSLLFQGLNSPCPRISTNVSLHLEHILILFSHFK